MFNEDRQVPSVMPSELLSFEKKNLSNVLFFALVSKVPRGLCEQFALVCSQNGSQLESRGSSILRGAQLDAMICNVAKRHNDITIFDNSEKSSKSSGLDRAKGVKVDARGYRFKDKKSNVRHILAHRIIFRPIREMDLHRALYPGKKNKVLSLPFT